VPEVAILIVDDDVVTQSALKSILDSEGWRVRIVPGAPEALSELAAGAWNLVIANIEQVDVRGPLFATLKELVHAGDPPAPEPNSGERTHLRALFLLPMHTPPAIQLELERSELPYSFKPYHLHDFLEKVSELLVEAGAIADPIRSVSGFARVKKQRREQRNPREARRGAMFASRDDYQMTEEEMAEFERQEDEDRKKRQKAQRDREHLG
jgi:hypothetical protein